jgi:hypothetical protein
MKHNMNTGLRQTGRYFIVMLLLILLGASLAVAALADDGATLTAIYENENVRIPNAEFRLYRVAATNEDGTFEVTESFKDANVSLNTDATEGEWSSRGVTLESYVVKKSAENDAITPTGAAVTNENGILTFANLSAGLYLLVGDQTTIGQTIYTPLATLVSLPYNQNNTRDYIQTVYIKNSSRTVYTPPPDTPTYTELSVVKVWKDEGHEESRPSEITVTLYRDGTEYSTVKLNSKNNWRHTWSVLSGSSRWQLVEKEVPENYTVTSVQEGKVFIVTNTYEEDTPETPEVPETPSTPDTPTPHDIPDTPSTPNEPLPQTGQLWWPVYILAVCGLILILIGIGIKRRENNSH